MVNSLTVHLFVILIIGAIQCACLFWIKDVGAYRDVTESLFPSTTEFPLPSAQGDILATKFLSFLDTSHMRGV